MLKEKRKELGEEEARAVVRELMASMVTLPYIT